MPQSHQPCFYRVSIKGVIVVDGKLLLTREHGSKRWDLPGGGIEHFEEPAATFKREIYEELGSEVVDFDESNVWPWFTYDTDPDWDRPILYLVYAAKISPVPQAFAATSTGEVEVSFFGETDFRKTPLEKHVEKFRSELAKLAFGELGASNRWPTL